MLLARVLLGRKWKPALALTILFASILVLASPTVSHSRSLGLDGNGRYRFKGVEKCFIKKINQRRQRYGLRALHRDYQLGFVSRQHAQEMASSQAVWHDTVGSEVTRWQRIAQNTGRGFDCGLFRNFWQSPTHRENILGRYKYVGVGTSRAGGYLYVQMVFESRKNPGNVYHTP